MLVAAVTVAALRGRVEQPVCAFRHVDGARSRLVVVVDHVELLRLQSWLVLTAISGVATPVIHHVVDIVNYASQL